LQGKYCVKKKRSGQWWSRRPTTSAACAKICGKNGGDLEPIKFLLGHASLQTTERYLGSEQEIAVAVKDNLGL
jgi:integrase